jgi:hypothetical protein
MRVLVGNSDRLLARKNGFDMVLPLTHPAKNLVFGLKGQWSRSRAKPES